MADLPRLPGQPPPLPPLPLRQLNAQSPEPFPPAGDDRAPDTLRLGAPLPRPPLLPPPDPLTEGTAVLLRQELALVREVLREALPTQPALPALDIPATEPALLAAMAGPGSIRTRSRALVKAIAVTKYGGVVVLGGLALRLIAKVWPASGQTIESILQALGL
jgi:hypothetical protein